MVQLERFHSLLLTGGASAVYDALPRTTKQDYALLRKGLTRAFSMNRFWAYEEFSRRRLRAGESVDIFLTNLRSFGARESNDLSDHWLICAFVLGLPFEVSVISKSVCQLEDMSLKEVVERASVTMSLRNFDV